MVVLIGVYVQFNYFTPNTPQRHLNPMDSPSEYVMCMRNVINTNLNVLFKCDTYLNTLSDIFYYKLKYIFLNFKVILSSLQYFCIKISTHFSLIFKIKLFQCVISYIFSHLDTRCNYENHENLP